MPRISELTGNDPTIACFYGPIGSGKSHFLMTGGDDMVILAPPNRLTTLKALQRLKLSDPIVEIMHRDADISKANSFDKYSDVMDSYLDDPKKRPRTIAIDELDHLRKGALIKALHVNNEGGKSLSLKNALKKGGVSEGLAFAAIQDFGAEMSLIEQFISYYAETCANLGVNFIVNAHERFTYTKGADKQDILSRISPGFTGKTFPDDVIGVFDLVWRFTRTVQSGKSVTYMDTIGNSQIRAKNCFTGKFAAKETMKEWNDPTSKGLTLLDIFNRVQGAPKNPEATFIPTPEEK